MSIKQEVLNKLIEELTEINNTFVGRNKKEAYIVEFDTVGVKVDLSLN